MRAEIEPAPRLSAQFSVAAMAANQSGNRHVIARNFKEWPLVDRYAAFVAVHESQTFPSTRGLGWCLTGTNHNLVLVFPYSFRSFLWLIQFAR
jgi:hypothetical protein